MARAKCSPGAGTRIVAVGWAALLAVGLLQWPFAFDRRRPASAHAAFAAVAQEAAARGPRRWDDDSGGRLTSIQGWTNVHEQKQQLEEDEDRETDYMDEFRGRGEHDGGEEEDEADEQEERTIEEILLEAFHKPKKLRPVQLLRIVNKLRRIGALDSQSICSEALWLLSSAKTGGFSDEALAVAHEMRKRRFRLSERDYATLLTSLKRDGEWELAISLFEEMKRSNIHGNKFTYGALVGALGVGKEWERAMQVFTDMKDDDVIPDTRIYTAGIKACEETGQWMAAMMLLTEVYEAQLNPDARIFTNTIGACVRGKQPELVTECLQQMAQESIVPTTVTYQKVIESCDSDWVKALNLLRAMSSDQVRIYRDHMHEFISSCGRSSAWEAALASVRMMRSQRIRWNKFTMAYLFDIFEAEQEWTHAEWALREAGRLGLDENDLENMEEPPRAAFVSSLVSCEGTGDWQRALNILIDMKARGMYLGDFAEQVVKEMTRTMAYRYQASNINDFVDEQFAELQPESKELPSSPKPKRALDDMIPLWARDR